MTLSKKNILIVDDSVVNRVLLKNLLSALGYNPVCSNDGHEALAYVMEHPVDIVLLDLFMPNMDGYELLQIFHENARLKEIPVIVISCNDEMDSIVRCIKMGAVDYMMKPFNSVVLKARIDSSLDRKAVLERERDLHIDLEINLESLKRAEKMRDFLVHSIIHDLRNNMSVVMFQIDLMSMRSSEKVKKEMNDLKGHILNMNEMMEAVLEVSKIDSGGLSLSIENVDIIPIIRKQVEFFQSRADLLSIHLVFEEKSKIFCFCDTSHFIRVIQNLLGNAIKYAPISSSVLINVFLAENGVIIKFSDEGEGIPDDLKEKVFDRFFQIETSGKTNRKGVGLGLTYCKTIVELMEGKIWIEDNLPQGATILVQLPIQESV